MRIDVPGPLTLDEPDMMAQASRAGIGVAYVGGCHEDRNAALDGASHLEPIVLCQVVAHDQNWEVIMTLAKISLASAAAITIISWGALAQENQNKGRITQLDHINGKITLQHAPTGTVGAAGASSLVDEYKIQDGLAKDLHAGDEVDFTAAQIGGVLTITKIQKK
jgi:Cu/Ag efflux protein CusF